MKAPFHWWPPRYQYWLWWRVTRSLRCRIRGHDIHIDQVSGQHWGEAAKVISTQSYGVGEGDLHVVGDATVVEHCFYCDKHWTTTLSSGLYEEFVRTIGQLDTRARDMSPSGFGSSMLREIAGVIGSQPGGKARQRQPIAASLAAGRGVPKLW